MATEFRPIPRLEVGVYPLTNVTPFTYRDGVTYEKLLHQLIDRMNTIIGEVNTNNQALFDVVIENMNITIDAVNAALGEQTDEVDTKIANLTEYVDVEVQKIVGMRDEMVEYRDETEAYRDQAEVFAANTEVLQDGAVSQLLDDPLSASRMAAATLVADATGMVDVRMFGAAGDGVTDDTTPIQDAANNARDTGRKLYISHGTFRITDRVDAYTDIECDGVILIDSDLAEIAIQRTLTPVTFSGVTLGGLVEGSTQVTGLGGQMGSLLIESTEHLIGRVTSTGQPYYVKSEICEVVDSTGRVAPPVDNTITDLSTATATLYPTEQRVVVRGLRLRSGSGVSATKTRPFMGVYRSNVHLDSVDALNTLAYGLINGIAVRNATHIEFSGGNIDNFSDAGSGYGVATYNTAYVTHKDQVITRCRHAISGRWNKQRSILRGVFEGGIDDHWGSGLTLDSVSSSVSEAGTHVLYSGKDVEVYNCDFLGGRQVVGIRFDTPELDGKLIIRGGRWKPAPGGPSTWMVCYSKATVDPFDYGRIVKSPRYVEISKIRVESSDSSAISLVRVGPVLVPHRYWGDILLEDIHLAGSGSVIYVQGDLDPAQHATDTSGMNVVVRGLTQPAASGGGIYISNTSDMAPPVSSTVSVDGCRGVAILLAERGVSKVNVRGSSIRTLGRTEVSTETAPPAAVVSDSEFASTVFSGYRTFDSRGNRWSGTMTVSQASIDNRIISREGDVTMIDATGAPSEARPNGYFNPAVYK